jgi:hypothetical protein
MKVGGSMLKTHYCSFSHPDPLPTLNNQQQQHLSVKWQEFLLEQLNNLKQNTYPSSVSRRTE